MAPKTGIGLLISTYAFFPNLTWPKRLKVLIVSTPWYPIPPVAYGGIEAFCWMLARGLADLGCEVTVLAPGAVHQMDPHIRMVQSLAQPATQYMSSVAPEIEHLAALVSLLEHDSFDIISDHSLFGTQVAVAKGLPTVGTAHRIMVGEFLGVYERISRQVPLVAISSRQATIAPSVEIHGVIHHCIDTQYYRPVDRPKRDFLLFLGSMNHHKGVHIAIDVAIALKQNLVIAAKCHQADEIAYFKSQAEPRLKDSIQFMGEIGGNKKLSLLQNASALIFPALWEESFGLVTIEALSCDTPVIAFDTGAAQEIIEDSKTGFIVSNVHQMIDAIRNLDAISVGACRASAVSKFDYRQMSLKYLEVFNEQRNVTDRRKIS